MSTDKCEECQPEKEGGRKIGFARAPYFQKHYATRVVVSQTEYDLRLELMNEKIKTEDTPEEIFIIDQMIILTPLAAKELSEQLEKVIKQWEDSNPIQPRPDRSIYNKLEVE